MLWAVFAMMTFAVVLALTRSLSERREGLGADDSDVAFYRGLLAEANDDVRCGLVAPEDAMATHAEIGRRLLASLDSASEGRLRVSRRWRPRRAPAVLAIVLVLPLVALASYLKVGAPSQPDMPTASRRVSGNFTPAAAISEVETRLAADPEDGRGFQAIAPIYLRMGRFQDAARAYRAALRLLGENAQERAALGQALTMAADGVVTAEARAAIDQALADDPKQPVARFFHVAAIEQDGDKDRARQLWEALEADTPAGAPSMDAVREHLDGLSGATQSNAEPRHAGQTRDDIAALSPEQRSDTIRGMVEGLADKLSKDGLDLQGWLQLIRSYVVLGERQKAEAAAASARAQLAGDAQALARIDELVGQLGLRG
ncbi:c-type cytochrome biogenesis protein CcmI [Bradyrhizobium japonicum]|uniref:c-type cytochrome biogenesis protein CcmI n=1 Tax=Bradyrhizobium japonicum TaxID=375 RepID=UPI001BA81194|nr:c-type cytochrome biogenesis protein CcmI [Bradyrhizobium japonicum]MBR0734806.1 c-type cytochrome biogenesis protein CcmI [Bradyrhizobium japonicum]MBR0809807.1 c-type cytochrome biogenesis protein CcmI [Bradyrhizobium japonicum]